MSQEIKNKILNLASKETVTEVLKSDFPLEIFPESIQSYFKDANETLESNIDYMACSFLWGCSTLIGNSCVLEVKSGWKEYANIWIACVGSAGVGKTPSISMATRPFERLNSDLITSYPRKLKDWEDSKDDPENKPKPEQFIVNDITIEALVALHTYNENAVGMFREELDGWVKNFSRYSNGSDLPFWLTTWSGKSVSMNRKTGNSFLPKPFIPILGGVQPAILESFSTDENKSSGFLDRILLCCPEIKIEFYNSNEMDLTAIQWYDDFVFKMARILKMNTKLNEDNSIVPNIFYLDIDAKYEWKKVYDEITIMQNSDEENEYMKSMLPKQKSYIPRFALILHVVLNIKNNKIPSLISKETILNAKKLSDYFIKQAKKVKVAASETLTIKSILSNNKELGLKEKFKIIFDKNEKLNYTKIAEEMNITRTTLYNWAKDFKNE